MSGLLNLTESPITLIADSGEAHRIEPSGYTAQVEYERRQVGFEEVYFHGSDRLKYVEIPVIEETPREIVVIDSATEINDGGYDPVIRSALGCHEDHPPFFDELLEAHALLLTTREVAEAAARKHKCRHGKCDAFVWQDFPPAAIRCERHGKPHPLTERMVWAASPEVASRIVRGDESAPWRELIEIIGYRELRRVAGVGR